MAVATTEAQESSTNEFKFNPYVYIAGSAPTGADSTNELKTATSLGFDLNDNNFCLVIGFNQWMILAENTEVYIAFSLDEYELIENKQYILTDLDNPKSCCFDTIMICESQEYCMIDWDIGTNVTRVESLHNDVYTLSAICKYIYLKYRLLQIEHTNTLNKLKIRKKLVEDWIVNSIIDAIKRKLKRCVKNNKREFEIQFKYVPKAIVLIIIGCYNGHTRKNKKFIIGWDKNKTSFDSRNKDARCHEWVFDAILYKGKIMILVNDEKDMIYRYYEPYTKYVGRLGTLTFGSKLMHKSTNSNSNWQK